jgi:hypothetical protein
MSLTRVRSCANFNINLSAWLRIEFFDTLELSPATSAWYPNVKMRAVGTAPGRNVSIHGGCFGLAAQVLYGPPVRPCMNTMLPNYQCQFAGATFTRCGSG